MPFFSRSKKSKKDQPQADEVQKPKPAPYRHKPTHAACDSMAMTPSGSRTGESGAIREAHEKRMSRNVSSQSLAVLASSNNLLKRNQSGLSYASMTLSTAPSAASAATTTGNVAKHPGYAAYETYDFSSTKTVPKVGAVAKGRSPLSSPPMSPVDSGASSSHTPSEKSLDLELPISRRNYNRPQRSRNHSRTSSVAIPVKDLAAHARASKPTPSVSSVAANDKRPPPWVTAAANAAAERDSVVAATPVAEKRRSKWLFGGSKSAAIAAH